MPISKSVLQIHWLPMFLQCFQTQFEKWHKQTKCLICVPTPLSFPRRYLHFAMVFTWFSNGTTNPKQATKQPKTNLQPLKWENWQRVRSRSFTFVLFCEPFKKTNNEPENKKPKNLKNKKHKKTKKQKNKIAHPKGGVVAESWVLSFFLFVWFCFAIAEMPGRNCQCLHSSDIAIADVLSKNCQCMCKRTVKKLHSEGVPFCFLSGHAVV